MPTQPTTNNPYAAPTAEVLAKQLGARDGRPTARRPIGIWLLLVATALLGALLATGTFWHIYRALFDTRVTTLRSLINASILALLAAFFVATAITTLRRLQIGRILGLVFLFLVAALIIFAPSANAPAAGTSTEYMVGWWSGRLFAAFLILAWAYASGWSSNARRYYAEHGEA